MKDGDCKVLDSIKLWVGIVVVGMLMVFVFFLSINWVEYFVNVFGRIVFILLVVLSCGEMFVFFVVGNIIGEIVGFCVLMVCVMVISVLVFVIFFMILCVGWYFK